MGILITQKFEINIESTHYISERIIRLVRNLREDKLYIVSIYNPGLSKLEEETSTFYEQLQYELNTIPIC